MDHNRKLRWWEHPFLWGVMFILACGGLHHKLTTPREELL